jgi:hypothetical protein
MIASLMGLAWVGHHAGAPDPEDSPGSGVVLRTEVTSIWVPRALCDLVRRQADPPGFRSAEELRALVERNGLDAAWYALNYRGYQVDGGSAEITQVRSVSEAADHLCEVWNVMATASGRPPRSQTVDFSPALVVIIPEALRDVDPREAITRLRPGPPVRDGSSHQGW